MRKAAASSRQSLPVSPSTHYQPPPKIHSHPAHGGGAPAGGLHPGKEPRTFSRLFAAFRFFSREKSIFRCVDFLGRVPGLPQILEKATPGGRVRPCLHPLPLAAWPPPRPALPCQPMPTNVSIGHPVESQDFSVKRLKYIQPPRGLAALFLCAFSVHPIPVFWVRFCVHQKRQETSRPLPCPSVHAAVSWQDIPVTLPADPLPPPL